MLVQRKFLDPAAAAVLRRHARKIVYDIDDALMHHNRPVGLISALADGATSGQPSAWSIMSSLATNISPGSSGAWERNVSIIPTMLDSSRYQVKRHEATPTPRLVWIGSRSTIQYVQQFLPALKRAAKEVPGLSLRTIANATVPGEELKVEHEQWTEETESAALCRGDIGIAPTPMDDWTMGKCGFKILQYMAAGLPVIASPVGANAELVKEGITGYLPKTPDDWPAAIAALAKDADLRARMGAAARELAATNYTLKRAADEWAGVLSAG